MNDLDPEWVRWAIATAVAIGSLAIAWAQYRASHYSAPRQEVSVESVLTSQPFSATNVAKIVVVDDNETKSDQAEHTIRGAWFMIACSRDKRGKAEFLGSSWQKLNNHLFVRNRDTVWLRVACLNVSDRLLHDMVVRIAELPFLTGLPARAVIYALTAKKRESLSSRRRFEPARGPARQYRTRNAFDGVYVTYLNPGEQVILDCVFEIHASNGRWRAKSLRHTAYPACYYWPPAIREAGGHYLFDDGRA